MLAGVLGSREAGRVHSVEDAIRLLKTPASTSSAENRMQNIRSRAPENGHNDAQSMLS